MTPPLIFTDVDGCLRSPYLLTLGTVAHTPSYMSVNFSEHASAMLTQCPNPPFFHLKTLFFCELKLHVKHQNPAMPKVRDRTPLTPNSNV